MDGGSCWKSLRLLQAKITRWLFSRQPYSGAWERNTEEACATQFDIGCHNLTRSTTQWLSRVAAAECSSPKTACSIGLVRCTDTHVSYRGGIGANIQLACSISTLPHGMFPTPNPAWGTFSPQAGSHDSSSTSTASRHQPNDTLGKARGWGYSGGGRGCRAGGGGRARSAPTITSGISRHSLP